MVVTLKGKTVSVLLYMDDKSQATAAGSFICQKFMEYPIKFLRNFHHRRMSALVNKVQLAVWD